MKIGLPGDKRRFRKPYLYDVTKDIEEPKEKWPRCVFCKEIIVGRKQRVEEGKWSCFRCANENP